MLRENDHFLLRKYEKINFVHVAFEFLTTIEPLFLKRVNSRTKNPNKKFFFNTYDFYRKTHI